MSGKKNVHVCLTPRLIDQYDVSDAIVVVIDVLRATTTMCAAFDHGVDHMVPVATIDEAVALGKQGYIVAGERSGEKVEGFDLGNSPFSYTREVVEGNKIVITTTNGTRAIKAAQEHNAKEIVVGAFPNISLLTQWLIEQNENVCLLCAGWRENVTLEDSIFAGAMVRRLRHNFERYQDTAIVAESLFQTANRRKRFFFRFSSHFNRLTHLNLQGEVKYAMRKDTHQVLPLMVGNALYDISHCEGDYKEYKQSLLASQEVSA